MIYLDFVLICKWIQLVCDGMKFECLKFYWLGDDVLFENDWLIIILIRLNNNDDDDDFDDNNNNNSSNNNYYYYFRYLKL